MVEVVIVIVLLSWVVVFALEDRYTGMPKESAEEAERE